MCFIIDAFRLLAPLSKTMCQENRKYISSYNVGAPMLAPPCWRPHVGAPMSENAQTIGQTK